MSFFSNHEADNEQDEQQVQRPNLPPTRVFTVRRENGYGETEEVVVMAHSAQIGHAGVLSFIEYYFDQTFNQGQGAVVEVVRRSFKDWLDYEENVIAASNTNLIVG